MLEVHAILQRQRCNENITKKTGTLSDAYVVDKQCLKKQYVEQKGKSISGAESSVIDEIYNQLSNL